MGAPASFEPFQQKEASDCTIASLAMVAKRSYNEVSEIALSLFSTPHETGLSVRDLQRVIKKLVGHPYESKKPTDVKLEEETGILFVKLPQGYHAVVLFQGVVYDPASGIVWNLHAYVATRKAHPVRLLRP